jgi:RHS repeat-associated protein
MVTLNNTKLASFDYNYRADGNRVSEAGFIAGYGPANYQWDYDALGRLTKETFTSNAAAQNFTAKYEFDLSSNRVRKTIDKFNNSTIDEVLTSLYDSNDRQLSETSSLGKATSFTYNQTQQATKTIAQSGVTQETMSMQYNLQGMLDSAVVQDYSSGVHSRTEKTSYRYSTEGTRISSKHEIDSNVDNIFESFTNTQKLTDSLNPTGYSQVLQETTTDHLGNVVKSIDYTLGFDQISQTVVTSSNPIPVTHYFQTDEHGSTRLLTTPGGNIVVNGSVNEAYHYDAYGLPINFDPATALTSYLKDSEPLDVHTNLIHLRARDYNVGQGVFTTLDGYSGNHLDPLSFNKYQFVHANPVMGVDPSGNEFSVSGRLAVASISGGLASIGVNGINNYINNNRFFDGAANSYLAGSVLGPLAYSVPVAGLVLSTLGVGYSSIQAYRVLGDDKTSIGQQAAALSLLALSVFGTHSSVANIRANGFWYNNSFLQTNSVHNTSLPNAQPQPIIKAVTRNPRDIAYEKLHPQPPEPNRGNSSISSSSLEQSISLNNYLHALNQLTARDIRVNQHQVNIFGVRVGINKPDLQFTYKGNRYYVEWDKSSSGRGIPHGERILSNDPNGVLLLFTVD